jgi:hypothetical protein
MRCNSLIFLFDNDLKLLIYARSILILAHMGHKVKQIIVPLEINVLYHVLTLEPT